MNNYLYMIRPGSKGLAKEQPEVHFSEDCQKVNFIF